MDDNVTLMTFLFEFPMILQAGVKYIEIKWYEIWYSKYKFFTSNFCKTVHLKIFIYHNIGV